MNPVLSTQAAAVSRNEANALVRQVNRLLNRQLSSVCQVNGVKSTGIKAELQKRIANRKSSHSRGQPAITVTHFNMHTFPLTLLSFTLHIHFASEKTS
jgi:hypothetical protein